MFLHVELDFVCLLIVVKLHVTCYKLFLHAELSVNSLLKWREEQILSTYMYGCNYLE